MNTDPVLEAIDELINLYGTFCSITRTPEWIFFEPEKAEPLPDQGWKIHVSATLPEARDILRTVGPSLIARKVSWKVAAGEAQYVKLLLAPGQIVQTGKFITIYSRSEANARAIADWLNMATRTFAGPVIPSDHRYLVRPEKVGTWRSRKAA